MKSRTCIASLALLALATGGGAQITTKLVASGLNHPLWAGAPDGDPRIFVVVKGGQIRVVENGVQLGTPFLNLTGQVSTGSEQGLLGLAFHPNYASNGFFYVDYTDLSGDTVVSRFTVSSDPNVADAASESIILQQNQPFSNHNGGDLHFGPDGYLYIFFGDGGDANDPACRAQKLTNLLGKTLRIDVDSAAPYAIPPDNPFVGGGVGVREEIFHYGLRNPWRNGFDRLTGDLYIGDVGQDLREEIDVAPAGSKGLNFGWKIMEGTRCNLSSACPTGTPACHDVSFTPPITELLHADGSFCITGGYVYRGCACPGEYGKYFYADYMDDKIRSLEYDVPSGTVSNLLDRTADLAPGGGLSIRSIASFGEDGFGELLIVDENGSGAGEVYKMVPAASVAASAVERNGSGANRTCLSSASLPITGNVWEARVDSAGHPGATFTYLFGYTAPASGTFVSGNELLMDLSSTRLFRLVVPSSGGSDVFRSSIPCDIALNGFTTTTQAMILGSGLELCNAVDLTVGYY